MKWVHLFMGYWVVYAVVLVFSCIFFYNLGAVNQDKKWMETMEQVVRERRAELDSLRLEIEE